MNEFRNNLSISSPDYMSYFQRVLIGSQWISEENEYWENKVYWYTINVYCRFHKNKRGIVSDIYNAFRIFSVYPNM